MIIKVPSLLLFASLALILLQCTPSNEKEDVKTDEHQHNHSSEAPSDLPVKKPLSPLTASMANIGSTHVHIDYSSPGVRGRVIWGGLVAFDRVWVAGAHNATSIEFQKDVLVAKQPVPKGKYAMFTIPGKETWTVILNENFDQHLADEYDQDLDVLRFEVEPNTSDTLQESLLWDVQPGTDNEGQIVFKWEYLTFSFEVAEA